MPTSKSHFAQVLQTLTLLLFLSSARAAGAAPSLRAEKALGTWRFQPGRTIAEAPGPDDWASITLPYLWTETWKHREDKQGKSWAKLKLRKLNSAWFETSVKAPDTWATKSVYLVLSGIQCDAVAWVNGRRVGEVKGPDGRLDITGSVPFGKTMSVRLWVTKWWEGTANQREQDIFRDRTIKSLAKTKWFSSEEEVRVSLPAGISEAVALRAVPKEAEVENVFVTTSYRRKKLSLRVTYTGQASTAAKVRVQVTELDGATAGLPSAIIPLEQRASDSPHQQTITLPWANPHLWEIGAGYLYRLRVSLLASDNRVVDVYPSVRFGFREVWTQGRELILNGHPIRLRLPYFVASVPQMLLFEGMGFNAMEMQPNPSAWYGMWCLFPKSKSYQAGFHLLDAADARGWAVLMPAPGVNNFRSLLGKPEVQQLYLRDLRTWFRQADLQNRPCILMWTPSMNTGSTYDPAKIGRMPSAPPQAWYGEVEQLIRSVDSSRLVFHHSGGQTGDMQTQNCYLNFVPLQEREDYLSAWSRAGEKPWAAIEHGPPASVNFFKRSTIPYFTEYAAIYFGDEAYAQERDEYIKASLQLEPGSKGKSGFAGIKAFVDSGFIERLGETTAYYRFMELFIRHTNIAWRGWGVNGGWFPWIFDVGFGTPPGEKLTRPGWHVYESLTETDESFEQRPAWASPIYDVYRDTMQPLLVFLGGQEEQFTAKDHSFYAGDSFEKSIVVVWDGPGSQKITVSWALTAEGKELSAGEERFALSPGAIEKRPLKFTAPEVSRKTRAAILMTVHDEAGEPISRDENKLTFFPRQVQLGPPKSRWAIYDPVGKTTSDLALLGLRPEPAELGAGLANTDVLVIGYKALSQERNLPFTVADIARGLRVVLFEQDIASLEAMGFRVQDVVPRYVFPRVSQHPILSGLKPSDLRNWRGQGSLLPETSEGMKLWPWPHGPHWGNRGSVASVVIETPHAGAFTPILDCEFDLAYSPLLLWRHGKGEIVFCQLDLTGRIGVEPAVRALARNLARYLDTKAPVSQNRQVTVLGDEAAVSFVRDLGMQCSGFKKHLRAKLSLVSDLLVIGPDRLHALAGLLPAVRSFVAAGGTTLVLPQSAKEFATSPLPWPLHLEPKTIARVALSSSDAAADLLHGIGPQHLHWRTFLNLNAFEGKALPASARPLLDGLLLKIPEGKGQWVFSQVDWRSLNDGSHYLRRANWNARKLYRQVLTNLGAKTDSDLAEQFLSPRFYAPMVNVSLWQVLNQPSEIDPSKGPNNSLPALYRPLPAEQWVQKADGNARGHFEWRLRGTDENGYLELAQVSPAQLGQAGYAVTHIFSSVPREANFALSSDWWFVFKVNGRVYVDQGKAGRVPGAPRPGEVRIRAQLEKGWNRLEMKVASGSGGFGFWCQVSDPGDLRTAPSVFAPESLPTTAPAPADLLKEPRILGQNLLYIEPLLKEDDPYGFTPW